MADLSIKDYMIFSLNEQETGLRRNIRLIKKDISFLQDLKRQTQDTPESKLRDMLGEDSDLLKDYDKLVKAHKEKEQEEIKKLVRSGKLKEVLYDKEGREIDSEGRIVKEGANLSRKQQQLINATGAEGRSSDASSGSDEDVS